MDCSAKVHITTCPSTTHTDPNHHHLTLSLDNPQLLSVICNKEQTLQIKFTSQDEFLRSAQGLRDLSLVIDMSDIHYYRQKYYTACRLLNEERDLRRKRGRTTSPISDEDDEQPKRRATPHPSSQTTTTKSVEPTNEPKPANSCPSGLNSDEWERYSQAGSDSDPTSRHTIYQRKITTLNEYRPVALLKTPKLQINNERPGEQSSTSAGTVEPQHLDPGTQPSLNYRSPLATPPHDPTTI
jgi:hypothetical protein